MGRFDNMSVFQAAVEAYGVEEAEGFMENIHRGSVSEAVIGDADKYVDPKDLTSKETKKMLEYLGRLADKQKFQPA